jgi:hypothetical protein
MPHRSRRSCPAGVDTSFFRLNALLPSGNNAFKAKIAMVRLGT